MNDNLLGRITALALILGAAYGVHAISRGGLGCPLGGGSCCEMAVPRGDDRAEAKSAPAPGSDADVDPDAPKNVPASAKDAE